MEETEQQLPNPTSEMPTEEPPTETIDPQPTAADNTETPASATEPEPTQPAGPKQPRMLSRISSELDGSTWKPPNFDVGPTRSRRRFVAAQVRFWDKEYDGPHEGSPDNTEPVPDDEPETEHDVHCTTCTMPDVPEPNYEEPEETRQANRSTQDAPDQEEQ